MSDITLFYCIPHPVFNSFCMVSLLRDRSETTLLFRIRIPYICHMFTLCGVMRSCILVIEGIDIDANVFTHQANTQRVSKPTNFERFPVHFSENTRQIWPPYHKNY